MARGGARRPTPGKGYSQRTDLNAKQGQPLPATAAPNQPYGQAGAQLAAQKALPMAGTPMPAAAAAPPAPAGPMPGDLPALTGPTNLPNEPVTHGLAVGPGAGPEALPQTINPQVQAVGFLNSMKNSLPPELRGVLASLQTAQTNGL